MMVQPSKRCNALRLTTSVSRHSLTHESSNPQNTHFGSPLTIVELWNFGHLLVHSLPIRVMFLSHSSSAMHMFPTLNLERVHVVIFCLFRGLCGGELDKNSIEILLPTDLNIPPCQMVLKHTPIQEKTIQVFSDIILVVYFNKILCLLETNIFGPSPPLLLLHNILFWGTFVDTFVLIHVMRAALTFWGIYCPPTELAIMCTPTEP